MAKREQQPRIFVTVTPEFDAHFTGWASRLGVTKSQFGNMCLQAGLSSVVRAVAPEEAFTPELLAQIIGAGQKQGLQLELSDLIKKDGK